jgi:tetratricopeptide (TPR) repeat protein
MSWQDDLKKLDEVFHQTLRYEATFEWLYTKMIDEAKSSDASCEDVIDGLIQLGKHVSIHAQYHTARRVFEKTLDLTQNKTGLDNMRAGKICDSLSQCLLHQGRHNEALSIMEKWVHASKGKLDERSYDHREIMSHYAEILYRAGKNEHALTVVKEVLNVSPDADSLRLNLTEKLTKYQKPCEDVFDPSDIDQAQKLKEETLHGSPASLDSLRQAVMEIVVKQAVAGAPWKELCRGPMEINGITEAEIEAEVSRRKSPAQSA